MYRVTPILLLSLLFPLNSLAQIFTLHPPNTTKLVSTDIRIDCTVLTSDLSIRWVKDGSVLSPTSSTYEITLNITGSGLTSIFHIYSGVFPNTGTYTCLAYRGTTLEEQSYPGELMIHGPVEYLESPLDQDVYLNEPIVLTCRIQGGPLPTLQWTRDVIEGNVNVIADEIISISTVEDSSYEISSRLAFTHAQSSHNGTYHCETGNMYGAADSIARLSVNNEAIQPVSIIQPTDGTTHTLIASSANSLSQPCTASGLPVPSLQWIFPASSRNAQVQINPTLTLSISNPTVQDAGTYTCVANNSLTSDTVSIQVNVVERPVVSASADTTVTAGGAITLSCTATGSPTPNVTLAHPNSTLLPLDQNGRFILYVTSYRDAGVYRCVATVLSVSEQATFTLTVLSAPAIITPPSDTSVGVGRDATFRCVVAGNPTPIIVWYFNTSTIIFAPIPSTLIIPNVHTSDQGEYTCTATNLYGAINASAALSIVPIPKFLTTPDSILANIGEVARFPCTATPSTVTLEWDVDGMKISNTVKYFVFTDGSLSISNLEFSDSNTYTCRISNPAGSVEASASLTVIERPTFIQEPLDQTVPEGEDVGFVCEVSGTPLPSLSWLDSSNDAIETGGKFTVSMPTPSIITLNITAVVLSNAGEYTCLAQNGLDVMSSARLSIINPPRVTIEPSTQNAILGLQFILTCIVTYSVPSPSFQWFKGSVRITTDSRVKSFTNGSLIISTVQSTDGGVYRCVAVNNVGSDTAIGNVVVVIRPTFAPTPSSHTVPLGGEVTIPCNAEGDPLPMTSWLLPDNTPAPSSGRFSWVSQVNGALTILEAERTDHGTFTCIATNAAGVIRMGIQLTVQVQPNAPTGASAVVVSESRVRVDWVVSFNGYSDITGYRIQKQIQGAELEDADLIWENSGKTQGEQDSALVTNLIPFEHHQFRVAAANVIGVGAFSMQTDSVQLNPSSPPPPKNATTRALSSTSIHLAWNPPTYPYGVLHSYEVAWGVRGDNTPLIISIPLPQGLQHNFTGLSIYTEYMFSIRAVNTNPSGGVFVGNFSDPVYQVTREEPPIGPPLNVTLQTVPGGILIGWNAPSPELRQGLITGYNVFYRESLMNLLFPTLPPLAINQTNHTNGSLLGYRNELAEYYQFGNMSFQMFLSPTSSDRQSYTQHLNLKPNVYYDVKLQAINSAGIGPNSTVQTAKSGHPILDLVKIIVPSVVVPIVVCFGIILCVIIVFLHQYYLNWKASASNRKTYRDSGSAGSRRPLVHSSSLQASNFEENRGFDDLTRKSKPSAAKRDSPTGKDESYLAAINEINRQIMESVGESDQEVTASGSESSDDESGSGSLSGINTDVFRVDTNKHAESAQDTAGDTSIYNYDSIMPRVGEERTGSFATTKQTDFDDDLGDTIREAPVLLSQDYSDDDDDGDEDHISEGEPPGDFYPHENSDLSDDERLTYTDYMKGMKGGEQPKPKPDSQVSMGEYSHISDVSRQAKRQQAQIRLDEKQVKEEKRHLEQEKKLREKIATRERKAREKRAKVERKEREKEAKQRLKERQQSFYNPNVLDPDVKYHGMAMRDSNKNKDVLF